MSINSETRNQLILLVRRPKSRHVQWTPESPTDWQPSSVRNPKGILDQYFTPSSAWEFIAEQLEAGCEVEVVEIRKPPGKKAYVMKIEVDENLARVYVKFEHKSGKIWGRSFHYSDH
jgi:hypothetical protein